MSESPFLYWKGDLKNVGSKKKLSNTLYHHFPTLSLEHLNLSLDLPT
jgi:hypothetical protein